MKKAPTEQHHPGCGCATCKPVVKGCTCPKCKRLIAAREPKVAEITGRAFVDGKEAGSPA